MEGAIVLRAGQERRFQPPPSCRAMTMDGDGDLAGSSKAIAGACWILLLASLALLLAACAAGANPQAGTMGERELVVGFWFGLWHGVIAPVTFVVSLFNAEVGVYEVHNVGAWYDFGFVLGLGFIVGGGSSGARTARR